MYRHGAAGTSTSAPGDAAGVSSSQICHYFAGKDDLPRAVIAFQREAIGIPTGESGLMAICHRRGCIYTIVKISDWFR
jgi:AcrR family transcriptional regulator